PGPADGVFGTKTYAATQAFQARYDLPPDGVAGNRTLGQAMRLGFVLVDDPVDAGDFGPNWPPPPSFPPLYGTANRQRLFGAFSFKPSPIAGNPENIEILGDWVEANIVWVEVAELSSLRGAPPDHKVQFHRRGVDQLIKLWESWRLAGLVDRVITWA